MRFRLGQKVIDNKGRVGIIEAYERRSPSYYGVKFKRRGNSLFTISEQHLMPLPSS